MTQQEIIVKEIENLPDEILNEVLDFIQFLKQKSDNKSLELTLASEASLSKEWLLPEEDE